MNPNLFRRLHTAASEATRRESGEEAGRNGETTGDTVRLLNEDWKIPSSERLMGPVRAIRRRLIAAGVSEEEFVIVTGTGTRQASSGRRVYHAADLAVLGALPPDGIRAVHAAMAPLVLDRGWTPGKRVFRRMDGVRVYAPWDREEEWQSGTMNWNAPITERDMYLDYVAPKLQTAKPGKPGKPLTVYMQRKYEALYQEACKRAADDEPGRCAYAAASLALAGQVTFLLRTLRDHLQLAEPAWEICLGPLPEQSGRERSLLARASDGALVEARVTLSRGAEMQIIGQRYPGRSFRNPPFPLVDLDNRRVDLDFLRDGLWQTDCPDMRLSGLDGTVKSALLDIAVNRCRSLAEPR